VAQVEFSSIVGVMQVSETVAPAALNVIFEKHRFLPIL
jgi:hypothetical protein